MTDWGDATLNEKARPRTWAQPPDVPPTTRATLTTQERLRAGLGYAPAPTPATWRHDKGDRVIPSGERGE